MLIKKCFLFFSLFFLIACHNKKNNNQNDVDIEQTNNDYQSFLNDYNSLTDYQEEHDVQLENCQELIDNINQHITNLTNDQEKNDQLINEYHVLTEKVKHKQQQLIINNRLEISYWFVGIIQIFLTIMIFIWYFNFDYNIFNKNNYFNKWLTFFKTNFIYKRLFATKSLIIKGKIYDSNKALFYVSFESCMMPLFYFLLMFIFNYLTFFDDHLANTIHYYYLLIKEKNVFKNNGLIKQKAQYFYYDHNTKAIINHEKYFTIPFLFTNNQHLVTNIFDFIVNLFNIIVFGWSIIKFLDKSENSLYTWKIIRLLFFTFVFVKLFSLANIISIHLFSENNRLNQFKLTITSFFKSLPVINKLYYMPKKHHQQKKLLPSSFDHLIPVFLIVIPLLAGFLIDTMFCLLCGIKYTFWFDTEIIIVPKTLKRELKESLQLLKLLPDYYPLLSKKIPLEVKKSLLFENYYQLSPQQLMDTKKEIEAFSNSSLSITNNKQVKKIVAEKITKIDYLNDLNKIDPTTITCDFQKIEDAIKYYQFCLSKSKDNESERILNLLEELKTLNKNKLDLSTSKLFFNTIKFTTEITDAKYFILFEEELEEMDIVLTNEFINEIINFDLKTLNAEEKKVFMKIKNIFNNFNNDINNINNNINNINIKLSRREIKLINGKMTNSINLDYDGKDLQQIFNEFSALLQENTTLETKDEQQLIIYEAKLEAFNDTYRNCGYYNYDVRLFFMYVEKLKENVEYEKVFADSKDITISFDKLDFFCDSFEKLAIVDYEYALTDDEQATFIEIKKIIADAKEKAKLNQNDHFLIKNGEQKKLLRKLKKRTMIFLNSQIDKIDKKKLINNSEKKLFYHLKYAQEGNDNMINLTSKEINLFNQISNNQIIK